MKRIAILFAAIIVILPLVRGEQSPPRGTDDVSASGVRDGGGFEPENLAVEIHNLLHPELKIPPLTVVTRQPSEPTEITEVQ